MSKSKYASLIEKIQTNDTNWEQRFKALKQLQELVPTLGADSLGDVHKSIYVLCTQLLDARSKIVKEASSTICQLACKFKGYFPISDVLIRECLKGLSNSNTVLRQYAQQTIQTLIVQCDCDKFITKLISQFESKNNYVRERISEYLLIIIQSLDVFKHKDNLEKCIEKGLNDKVENVRKTMRRIYIQYQKEYPNAESMLLTLDPTIVKIIQQQLKMSQISKKSSSSKEQNEKYRHSLESEKENIVQPKGAIQRQNIKNIKQPQISQRQSLRSACSKIKSSGCKSRQQYSSVFAAHMLPISNFKNKHEKQQHQYIKYKQQRNQDIQFLIEKVQSEIWNTRLLSLTKLIQVLQNEEYADLINEATIKIILNSVVKRLEDTHQKVSHKAAEGLSQIFPYYTHECLQHCLMIIKRCVRGLTEKAKQVFQQLLCILKSFDMTGVFSNVVKLVEQCKNKQKLICLDLMIEILQCDASLVQSKDVNHLFKLMTHIMIENKAAAIPALAVISILRQHHESRMWSCFIHLSDHQLSKMIELAADIDPALEYAIINFTKTNPKTAKEQYESVSNKQKEISLLNISELQSFSRNPQFINEYIGIIYDKIRLGQSPCVQKLSVLIKNNQFLKEQSLLKLFDILHLSANQAILVSINNIIDLMLIEAGDLFVKCLCEVIKLAKGIHLDMYLQKLKNLVKITPVKTIQLFTQYIIQVSQFHLQSQQTQLRRTCIIILSQLKNKLKTFPLSRFNNREQRLIQKYSKLC